MSADQPRPRVLFLCGSINQTSQLHAVAGALPEVEAWYSPYYGNGLEELFRRLRLTEMTIAGNKRRAWCLEWLRARGLPIDDGGARGPYHLVVTSTDVIVQRNLAGSPLVVVQEGILDPERLLYRLVRALPFLPRWLAGTAMTGLSGAYARFCAMSDGYRDHLIARGADPGAVVVTGVPNFDNCDSYRNNAFPHRGYLLVCTSDGRETFKADDRPALIRRAQALAAGRPLLFKLHPNEELARARAELARLAPEALVFDRGSAEEMIANCDELLTEWSSTVFVGVALGKKVHTNFDEATVRRLAPLQNGGSSARNIAEVCRALLPGPAARGAPARPAAGPAQAVAP
jgi:hypothetical protein